MDGTVVNLSYGLFPQGWLDGASTVEGVADRSGDLWDRRRRVLQRHGECWVRMCADVWSMACFL